MKWIALSSSLFIFFSATVVALGGQTVVFSENFNHANRLNQWHGKSGKLIQGEKENSQLFLSNSDKNRTVSCNTTLPANDIAGRLVTLQASVKASNVSTPPKSWNGIKVMLSLTYENGKKEYPQLSLPFGTFDWRSFTNTFRVRQELVSAKLVLGLERASGNLWLDDIKVSIGPPVFEKGAYDVGHFKGHDLKQLRGVMYGPHYRPEDLKELAKWNVNFVRWQIKPIKITAEMKAHPENLENYSYLLNKALSEFDKALKEFEKSRIMVLLDLHYPPGGRSKNSVCNLFFIKAYQEKLIETWKQIAKRYKGNTTILAYDILNEPNEPKQGKISSWRDIAIKVIDAIRQIDADKPIVYEAVLKGSNSFDMLEPLYLDKIIYSFHIYSPLAYTYQGIKDGPTNYTETYRYPGIIQGWMWNKERLRETLKPALEFGQRYNAHIIVGEFSAVRWAPDAHQYLSDLIELFEEYEWDWAYHAFREYHGWSLEHGANKANRLPVHYSTYRKQLLLQWFSQNEKKTSLTQ